jgi:hypothetical protein
LLLAAATLTRPITLGLPLLEAPLLLWCWRQQGLRALVAATLFVGLAATPVAVWAARNMAVAGYPGVATVADHNLYYYRAAAIEAQTRGRSFYDVQAEWQRTFDQRHPGPAQAGEAARALCMRAEALAVIRAHPDVYVVQAGHGLVRTLTLSAGVEALRALGRYPAAGGMIGRLVDEGYVGAARYAWTRYPLACLVMVLLTGLLALEYVFALRGTWRQWHSGPRRSVALPVVVMGALLVFGAGPESEPRFRHAIMALLAPLVAVGLRRANRADV